MLPPEASNSTTVDPEKCNIVGAQDKDFKIANIKNMFKDHKKEINKCLNEVCENKNSRSNENSSRHESRSRITN